MNLIDRKPLEIINVLVTYYYPEAMLQNEVLLDRTDLEWFQKQVTELAQPIINLFASLRKAFPYIIL